MTAADRVPRETPLDPFEEAIRFAIERAEHRPRSPSEDSMTLETAHEAGEHEDLEEFVVGCALCDAAELALVAEEEARYRRKAAEERAEARARAKARAAWIVANPEAIAWCCDSCGEELTDDATAEAGPLYECSSCGTRFTRDGSADGDSNRCPDCNRFGARVAELSCPVCQDGALEEVGPA